jgi:hypothetical protein
MVSVERFYLRHMAFVKGCEKEEAIRLMGRAQLFSSILANEIEVRDGRYYWG